MTRYDFSEGWHEKQHVSIIKNFWRGQSNCQGLAMVKHEIEDVGFEVFDMPCMTFSGISQGSSCYICLARFRSSKTSHVKKTHRQVVGHASWASVVAAVALPLWSQPWFIDGRKQISEEDFDGCSWCHDVRFFLQEFVPWVFGVSLWFFIIFVYCCPLSLPHSFMLRSTEAPLIKVSSYFQLSMAVVSGRC